MSFEDQREFLARQQMQKQYDVRTNSHREVAFADDLRTVFADPAATQALHGATDELVKGSAGIVTKESNPPGKFESRHKIGDLVTITARVAGIQFTDSKVRYAFDLSEQLAMVDSEHVEPAQPVGKD